MNHLRLMNGQRQQQQQPPTLVLPESIFHSALTDEDGRRATTLTRTFNHCTGGRGRCERGEDRGACSLSTNKKSTLSRRWRR